MKSKEKILCSAIFVFALHGKSKTSVAEIAQHAKVSKPLLFHHFSNKDTLYEEAFTYALGKINEIKTTFVQFEGHFFDKLYAVQVAKYKLEQTIPNIFKFIMNEVPSTPSYHPYPFQETDLALFKEGVDPDFVYHWFYVVSLGYRQLLLDGSPADQIFSDFAKTFSYIKSISLKEEQ